MRVFLLTQRLDKILWPLLHYQMHEIKICSSDWDAYQSVNRAFATALVPVLEEGDVVWIQDYHLFLLPSYLRQLLELAKKKVRLEFFLHTVFPGSVFFRILPMRRDILEGLLACDVVGFHNHDYTTHFLKCCEKILYVYRTSE
jgi:trehalose-6-phosphate synthase